MLIMARGIFALKKTCVGDKAGEGGISVFIIYLFHLIH